MDREALIAELRRRLQAEQGIAWAYLFGSAVRDGPFRDLDVACMPAEGAFQRLLDWGMLIERLGRGLPLPLDLVDLRRAQVAFAGPLLESRLVLLDRTPADRTTWEAETTSRWLDLKPALERYRRLRREALQQRAGGPS